MVRIKKSCLILVCSFFSLILSGQSEYTREAIEILTSDSLFGRGYLHDGDKKAADYIASEFEKAGVIPFSENDYFQKFNLNVNTFPHNPSVEINGEVLTLCEDYLIYPHSGSSEGKRKPYLVTPENVRDLFVPEKLQNEKFLNKHVFVVDPSSILEESADSIKTFRSLIYLLPKVGPTIYLTPDKFMWHVSDEQFKHAALEITMDTYKSFEKVKKIELNVQNKFKNKFNTQNVIGYTEAKEPTDDFIVFMAHYDHLGGIGDACFFPGANDNASGTAMLFNLAKHFAENPGKFNVAYMAFSGEEAGLLGSKYYIENPLFPVENIAFVINFDILGSAEEGITVVNATEHADAFEQLTSINEEKNYLPAIKSRGKAANSDHHWFTEKGVPAFYIYTLGSVKAYHDPHDTADGLPLAHFDDIHQLIIDFVNGL